ncbi:hypothetical protein [Ferruginibacter sp. HRS2-29]|uniref:hypothetical protein n=1 Tax=Ferruginibacter sp. HRS2-29 TaxID=2487334 RepID=UPI0020CF5DC3|nr:hypothetical protein [Ferruginibacter sp. HRS2-29]MCP9749998.1 hypothetical protein [Ferruginibacter sp. HRS2-29]
MKMTIFKYFFEKSKIADKQKEPISLGNLELYIKQNGLQKSKGYLEALQDFNRQLIDIFYVTVGNSFIPKSTKNIFDTQQQIFNQNVQLITLGEELIEKLESQNEKLSPE